MRKVLSQLPRSLYAHKNQAWWKGHYPWPLSPSEASRGWRKNCRQRRCGATQKSPQQILPWKITCNSYWSAFRVFNRWREAIHHTYPVILGEWIKKLKNSAGKKSVPKCSPSIWKICIRYEQAYKSRLHKIFN